MPFKQGDLVTVNLGSENTSSNTYRVARKLEGEALLCHPLFPDCYILRPDSELDLVIAKLKSPTERCLDFVAKYSNMLGYEGAAEAEELALYFVVRRKLSARQKQRLSNLCGKIAAIKCENDIQAAVKLVSNNVALLDSHNHTWYRNLENRAKIFSNYLNITTISTRVAVLNMTGFVLAQLEGLSK